MKPANNNKAPATVGEVVHIQIRCDRCGGIEYETDGITGKSVDISRDVIGWLHDCSSKIDGMLK